MEIEFSDVTEIMSWRANGGNGYYYQKNQKVAQGARSHSDPRCVSSEKRSRYTQARSATVNLTTSTTGFVENNAPQPAV